MNALIVGSGIIGLTSAVRLQEAGFSVQIVTKALPEATTSAVAAAVWYPYEAYPHDKVVVWSRRTLDVCYTLAEDPATGVTITQFLEVFDRPVDDPWWKPAVRRFERARPADLPADYVDGYRIEAPLIEPSIHLAYLLERFRRGGGTLDVRPEGVADLGALAQPSRLVVNCTGLGARELCHDDTVFPIRGQVVRVKNPGLAHCLADDEGPRALAYIVPRRTDCILGGTAEAHAEDLTPDPATTARILRHAAHLDPRLRDAEVLGVAVGLRPGRPVIRLEAEPLGGGTVIHNYGHGGAGFTLAWGCADAVVAQARTLSP